MCLENHKLFRLPWSFNDNPVAILELTDLCNLRCEGCYRSGIDGHKSLEQLKKEVILLKKARNIDSINLAGGEPLMHPQLIEIIEFIRGMGIKPSLITNGELLTKKKLLSLKKAGLVSIGIHIDSFQNRPGWEEKSEIELNTLRLYYAEMITRLLKIRPGFFLTIHLKNFQYTTEIVQWALDNIKYVGGITFFIFRAN